MKNLHKTVKMVFILFTIGHLQSHAQNKTVTYVGDTVTMFANPERGWYYSYSPDCCDKPGASCELPPIEIKSPHAPIVLSDLKALRNTEERITLYRDIVKINQYSGPIPQSRLDAIQADLNTARTAGLKVLFRIIYNYSVNTGEPCASVIEGHLDQLKNIVEKNSDIIFCVQAGLFGGSGEACCQSWLLDSNNNGWSSLSTNAKALYKKLISYVPKDRFVNLRYPRYKYQIFDWIDTDIQPQKTYPTAARPITADEAFSGSDRARWGLYQENFAGDENGYGFFNAWGQKDRDFVTPETKYTLMEGELSWGTDYNKLNGAMLMKKDHYTAFHYSTFGGGYEGGEMTIPTWKGNGQFNAIGLRLGYRFRLISASIPQDISANRKFTMSMTMKNDGWARIVNPRNVEIVFKSKAKGTKYTIKIDGDGRGNRIWLPGEGESKILSISEELPTGIETGAYDLYLNLPDPYASLHDNPLYSIRLGNKGIWDETTGYNSLLATVNVTGLTANAPNSHHLSLNIFPNPAKDALTISGDLNDRLIYEISSVEGRMILEGVVINGEVALDNLKPGLYIIKIKTEVTEIVQRFVKE